jgi:hypothetical protein
VCPIDNEFTEASVDVRSHEFDEEESCNVPEPVERGSSEPVDPEPVERESSEPVGPGPVEWE